MREPADRNDPQLSPEFLVWKCTRLECGLRFTAPAGDPRAARCPLCRSDTVRLGRGFAQSVVEPGAAPATGPELEVLLDNIRSAWNVGSMLRAADGAGVRMAHLCGISSRPDNPKVWKTSLGAERSVPWRFHFDGAAAASELKAKGLRLWALEGGPRAVSLFEAAPELAGGPILLVAGNELTGVDPGILEQCERVVSLPMGGIKGSLNVAVAFGIAVYFIRFGRREYGLRSGQAGGHG